MKNKDKDIDFKCANCQSDCKKRGWVGHIQRYECKHCGKTQQKVYTKNRISKQIYDEIMRLNNEGMSICSMSRYFKIAKSSVQRIIERLAKTLVKPMFPEIVQNYEIDELRTFCARKTNEIWLIYAINRQTMRIVDFFIGRRTKENIKKVVDSLLALNPKHIYSDRLNIYLSLIPNHIHKIHPKCTNHIERKNLTLRMLLKRLQRKSICFTRSEKMLYNTVYLWVSNDSFTKKM
jgi:IS1 family transposase/transposase-like protein